MFPLMRVIWLPLMLTFGLMAASVGAQATDVLDRVVRAPGATGALLTTVTPDGEAYRAGLREGDIVLRFAGKPVLTAATLTKLIESSANADVNAVLYFRETREGETTVRKGALGISSVSVQKGKAVPERLATPYAPNFDAITSGDSYYDFVNAGKKAGFEHRKIEVNGDDIQVDHLVRFKMPEFDGNLHMELTLKRGRTLPVQRVRFHQGRELTCSVKREGVLLRGQLDGKDTQVRVAENALPSWAIDLVALTMPRKIGECVRFSMLNEGDLSITTHYELYCDAKEKVRAGGKEWEAYRYVASRFGSVANRFWITEDNRIVRSDFNGPWGELTDRESALKGLPSGVVGE